MKIYTYYENVGMPDQEETLALWEQNWRESGFEPVVLNEEYSKSNKRYQEIKDFIYELHVDSIGIRMPEPNYWMAVHFRYLAYTYFVNENMLCMDYDIFNISLKPDFKVSDEFTYHDGLCACCCSGKGAGFINWLDLCIKYKSILKEKIKQDHAKTGRHYYGNDFFLDAIKEKFQDEVGTILPSNQKFIGSAWHHRYNKPRDLSKSKMVHFSAACSTAYNANRSLGEQPRVARNLFIREFLNL